MSCESDPGNLYPNTSKVLTLKTCLPAECSKVGDEVVIQTKFNTVRGIINWIDGKNLRLSYNAEDAGYEACYQLENCDVTSVRCFNCCDDRYFELDGCELTEESIAAAIGPNPKLTGNIFLYSGDQEEPDCLYKWNGFNDIGKPENWIDMFGKLPAQFEQLSENGQLQAFLEFLAGVFSGNGIAFNVSEYGENIIVTVGEGDGFGPSTFSWSYSGGTVTHNANDGSGNKTFKLIERGANMPTEPYGWFFYINQNTNGLFVNVAGEAKLVGFVDDPNPNTCQDLVNCIVTNIQNGALDPERYAMPEVEGPNWRIGLVTYGEETVLSADFSACTTGSTDLDDLVSNLNSCDENPSGWEWINNGGVLTLCVPTGTHVLTVPWGNPYSIINFNGVPTTPGEEGADLCLELANCIADRGLLDAHIEEVVQSSTIQAGDIMLSVPVIIKDLTQNQSFNSTEQISGANGIPEDAKAVTVAAIAYASTGTTLIRLYNDHYLSSDPTKNPYTIIGDNENNIGDIRHWKIKLKSDGSIGIQASVANTSGSFARLIILSYSK